MLHEEDDQVCGCVGWDHKGFCEAVCWHFKLDNGMCIRHQFSCELGGCGEMCICATEWEPDFDES